MTLGHRFILWKEPPQNVLNGLVIMAGSFIHLEFFVAKEIMAEMDWLLQECLQAGVLKFQFIFLNLVIKERRIFKLILQSFINILQLIFILSRMRIIFIHYQKTQ